MEKNEFKSSSEIAYEIIRDKIIKMELEPGEKLTRREMAKLTGVSIIPVIEALHRLENEGLVVSKKYYGTKVITIDKETIRDRFCMRMAIECEAVRILNKIKTEESINSLFFLARQLDSTSRTEESELFWERHYEFHLKIVESSKCQSFVNVIKTINLFDILKRTALRFPTQTSKPVPPKFHENLISAIITLTPEEAVRAMREHILYSGVASYEYENE
jgi:DNA-binding GntR family transcriptional regulator